MKFQTFVPNRRIDEPVVALFAIYDDTNFRGETRANITVEVTAEFIQQLRATADQAERSLAKRDKELAIRAAIMAAEGEGA